MRPAWGGRCGRSYSFNLSTGWSEVNEKSSFRPRRHGRCTFPHGGPEPSLWEVTMPEQATKSIIVGAGVREVFEAWSNFENFPHFMKNIKSVEKRPDGSTHWTIDRKSTRLNSSHTDISRMPSSA